MVKKYNSDYTMVKIVNLHDISSIYNSDLCSKSYVQYISNDYTSDFTAYNRVQYCNKWFNLLCHGYSANVYIIQDYYGIYGNLIKTTYNLQRLYERYPGSLQHIHYANIILFLWDFIRLSISLLQICLNFFICFDIFQSFILIGAINCVLHYTQHFVSVF